MKARPMTSTALPLPIVKTYDDVTVIDDSKIGSKFRMAVELIGRSRQQTFNFASSPFGASPLAMAEACIKLDRRLNLFYPYVPEDQFTDQMKKAREMGAHITIVNAEEHIYVAGEAQSRDGQFISFDSDDAIEVIADTARALNLSPQHVWAAGGLGGITRGLQRAWKGAEHHAVAVVHLAQADYGNAHVIHTATPFNEAATGEVPFPCNRFFEAKAWHTMKQHSQSQTGIVFWNPAAR